MPVSRPIDIQVSPVRKKNVTATSSSGSTCARPDPVRHSARTNQVMVKIASAGTPTAVSR